MEEHKEINNRLDELFAKVRTSKPVMGVDEVRSLIATAPVTGLSNNKSKTSKGNSTLYILIAGIAIIAVSAFAWIYSNNDENQSANSVPVVQNTNQPIVYEENTNTTSQQQLPTTNSQEVINNNESASKNDNTAKTETSASKDIATTEKSKPIVSTSAIAAEKNAEPSKNKTVLVTGGDFVVNFQTEDKTIKMKLKADDVKELNINGNIIPGAEYSKYKDIIAQGKKIMADEKSKEATDASTAKTPEEQKRDDTNTRLFNAFTTQLVKDKLINEDKYTFKLTSSELIIDGKTQPDAIRQKYLDLFKATAGRDLGSSVFKFNHGMD